MSVAPGSRKISVSAVTRPRAEQPGFDSQQGRIILFIITPRYALGQTKHPINWYAYRGISSGTKRLKREVSHSFSSSAKVKHAWTYISIPPYVYMSGVKYQGQLPSCLLNPAGCDLRSSWQTNSRLANQRISRFLKAHHVVHNNLPFVLILSKWYSPHFNYNLFKMHFNIILPSTPHIQT
jgi:hypothetical protein